MDYSEDNGFIKSCASLLQSSTDHAQIIEILERLQSVSITIDLLKSTRIGIIVNKLTKRNDLPSTIHTFAFELVKSWKSIATASAGREKLQNQYAVQPTNPLPSASPSSSTISYNRKRTLSNMQTNDTTDTGSSRKRQRLNTNNSQNSNSSMFAFGGNKKVLSLQQICIDVMKKNAMKIGKLPEMHPSLIQQIYGGLKPLDLKKVYKANPHLRRHLDLLWRRQLKALNPKYVKTDDSMTWFKAYQLYLIDKKDKLESAKQKLAQRHEEAKNQKESRTRLLSNDEARRFKAACNNSRRRRYRMDRNQAKKSKMMKDCRDFVNRRNRMFQGGLRANNKNAQAAYNKQQSFIRRQKELREKRKADRNRLIH